MFAWSSNTDVGRRKWLSWGLPRAFRFALRVPVCFRKKGHPDWCQGRTENMSRSGVLFTSEETLQPEVPLEMVFVLPVASTDDSAVVLQCQGRVVRASEDAASGSPSRMAATFVTYQFLRTATVEEA